MALNANFYYYKFSSVVLESKTVERSKKWSDKKREPKYNQEYSLFRDLTTAFEWMYGIGHASMSAHKKGSLSGDQ